MNQDELDAIAKGLGITLPGFYRSAALAGRLEPAGIINTDARSVIAINHALRDGEFGDEDWPKHVFAFGDDGGGNFFCLDLSSPGTKVLLRHHETLELLHEAGEFEPWLAGSPASWQSGLDDGSSR